MNEVRALDPETDPRWDAFVESHPHGWLTHTSGWTRVLKRSFGHMRQRCLGVIHKKTRQLRAILPLYEVQSWLTGNRLVSSPLATLSDPLASRKSDYQELLDAAIELACEIPASYLEINTGATSSQAEDNRFSVHNPYRNHFLNLECGSEELRNSLFPHHSRAISKARRKGLRLRIAERENDLRSYYRLHTKNRKRLSLPPQPYEFFQALWDEFQPNGKLTLLFACRDGSVAAGLMLFKFKQRVSGEFSAWDISHKDSCPSHFLWWEGVQMAHSGGSKIFDFGRTHEGNDGLMNFKHRFGTNVRDLPVLIYPTARAESRAQRQHSLPARIVKLVAAHTPSPVLPLLGRYCYRHLG